MPKDRLALVYGTSRDTDGINFLGVETPAFQLVPSCFALRVKHCIFVTISADFIISERAGFPYLENACSDLQDDGRVLVRGNLVPGSGRLRAPFLNLQEFPAPSTTFYQPITPRDVAGETAIIGPVFHESIFGTSAMPMNARILLRELSSLDTLTLFQAVGVATYHRQNWLVRTPLATYDTLPERMRLWWNKRGALAVDFNDRMAGLLEAVDEWRRPPPSRRSSSTLPKPASNRKRGSR